MMTKQERYDEYFIQRCTQAAKMYHCNKLQVGAVAVRDNRTILDGWNGTVPGQDNCCEEKTTCLECDNSGTFYAEYTGKGLERQEDCTICNGTGFVFKTKPTVIHAERNIIFYAARKGISLEGATMYITHNPCIGCAQAMVAAGITRVVYKDFYKNDEGLQFLQKCNVAFNIHKRI